MKLSKTPLANAERRWNGQPKAKNEIRNLSAKTINNCLTVLPRMLSIARKRGVIATVPELEWLRPPRARGFALSRRPKDVTNYERAKKSGLVA